MLHLCSCDNLFECNLLHVWLKFITFIVCQIITFMVCQFITFMVNVYYIYSWYYIYVMGDTHSGTSARDFNDTKYSRLLLFTINGVICWITRSTKKSTSVQCTLCCTATSPQVSSKPIDGLQSIPRESNDKDHVG